jgi:hypothetical protein
VISRYVRSITEALWRTWGRLRPCPMTRWWSWTDYLGEGYGVLNQSVTDAIGLLARKEGILLDPVYSGKAMAGFLDLAHRGYFGGDEPVVFLHTGGTPALFPYREGLLGAWTREDPAWSRCEIAIQGPSPGSPGRRVLSWLPGRPDRGLELGRAGDLGLRPPRP